MRSICGVNRAGGDRAAPAPPTARDARLSSWLSSITAQLSGSALPF